VVPLFFTRLMPMGAITPEATDFIFDRIIAALRDNGPWDAVLLPLHGAAVSEPYPDADGELVRRVRALVGPEVPIGVALDMHANIAPQMVEQRRHRHGLPDQPAHRCLRTGPCTARNWCCAPYAARSARPARWKCRRCWSTSCARARSDAPMKDLLREADGPGAAARRVVGQRGRGLPVCRCGRDGHVLHRDHRQRPGAGREVASKSPWRPGTCARR
jgi:hypothetical protein